MKRNDYNGFTLWADLVQWYWIVVITGIGFVVLWHGINITEFF